MEGGEEILKIFAGSLRRILERAPVSFEKLQEVRLRVGMPFLCRLDGKEYGFTGEGAPKACGMGQDPALYRVSGREIRETLEYAGNYSLYAYEEEFRQGYLTIQGGHRIGVMGKAVTEKGSIRAMRHISFLNIRLAHQITGCAEKLLPWLWEGGQLQNTLIVSPPGGGKTTMLRDVIRLLSTGTRASPGMNISVADERSELAACYQGIPQNDMGIRTDVLDGCPKAQGLSMLIRTMSPAAVAADEIGSREDLEAVREAGRCGCKVLATAHGASLEEIREKEGFGELFGERFFGRYLVLSGRREPGKLLAVHEGAGKLLWKAGAGHGD